MPYTPLGRAGDDFLGQRARSSLRPGVAPKGEYIFAGGTDTVLRSHNYQEATAGWAIFGDGTAQFADITIRNLYSGAGNESVWIEDGTMTLGGTGDERIIIDPTGVAGLAGRIDFYGNNALVTTLGASSSGEGYLYSYDAQLSIKSIDNSTGAGPLVINAEGNEVSIGVAIGTTVTDVGFIFTGDFTVDGTTGSQIFVSPDGTASLPVYSFLTDPDLGLYRVNTNDLGITAGGSLIARFRPADVQLSVNLDMNGNHIDMGGASIYYSGTTDPSVRFASTYVGLYLSGWMLVAYSDHIEARTTYFDANSYRFYGDTDTKIDNPSANNMRFITGGTERMRLQGGSTMDIQDTMNIYAGGTNSHWYWWTSGTSTEVVESTAINTLTNGGAANVIIGSSANQIRRSTSSLKYKPDWEFADEEVLAAMTLPVPIVWSEDPEEDLAPEDRLSHDTRQHFLGFGTEHVAQRLPLHATQNDYGYGPEVYDPRSLIAILTAKVRRLERLAGLTPDWEDADPTEGLTREHFQKKPKRDNAWREDLRRTHNKERLNYDDVPGLREKMANA